MRTEGGSDRIVFTTKSYVAPWKQGRSKCFVGPFGLPCMVTRIESDSSTLSDAMAAVMGRSIARIL